MHLGERQYSPDFQRQLTETATRAKSFEQAATIAHVWTGRDVSSRTIARIAEEAGRELVRIRDVEVNDFTHHRRHAEGPDPRHELAAVFVDGGRVQVRDESSGPGVPNERWQEDKIARLQTMTTATHAVDPCPDLPACFAKPVLASEGSSASPAPISLENTGDVPTPGDGTPPREAGPSWQPKPLVRTCVGTMQPLDAFRWMGQAEATRRQFFPAPKKAFVADGSHGNWSLWTFTSPTSCPFWTSCTRRNTCTRRRSRSTRRHSGVSGSATCGRVAVPR